MLFGGLLKENKIMLRTLVDNMVVRRERSLIGERI